MGMEEMGGVSIIVFSNILFYVKYMSFVLKKQN